MRARHGDLGQPRSSRRCRSRRALSPTAYSPGAAPDDDGVNSDPQQQQSTSVETLASLERCMRVANLETEIQVCEEAGDLRGAIAAYTTLLALQVVGVMAYIVIGLYSYGPI